MHISVIGLGKLGTPLAAVLASKGHQVVGVDLNPVFVEKINRGEAPVAEPCLQELITAHKERLRATVDCKEAVLTSDVTFLIVPTPSEDDGSFSSRYLLDAVKHVGIALKEKEGYHLIVITSTVMPGSTGGEIREVLEEASGRCVGVALGLCYNPEFIALGSVVRNMLYPDMILIGESDRKAGDLLEQIYLSVCENRPPVKRMNLPCAEIAKLAVNTFVTTKISYANMLSDLCDRLPGADVDVVTNAIGLDSRIGTKYLKGGTAFGGPCFPRDNGALTFLARARGARVDLAEATQALNLYQHERLCRLVHQHGCKRVAVLGLSYKVGTYVVEESPGVRLANHLAQEGYSVSVYDPMACSEAKKVLEDGVKIAESTAACIEQAECVVIMIPWPEFQEITPSQVGQKVVLDCWRIFPRAAFESACCLVYLGYQSEEKKAWIETV